MCRSLPSNNNKALKAHRKNEALARRCSGFVDPEETRYKVRSTVKRAYAALKDNLGGRHIRVRGHARVYCHLMFGVLAMTAEQLLRLAAPD